MDTNKNKPTAQLPDETDEAYARFLIYLSMGPGRTVDEAYRLYQGRVKRVGKALNSAKRRQSSGQWDRESVTYQWRKRAAQWDIEMLTSDIQETVTLVVHAVNLLANRILSALQNTKLQPQSFAELLKGIEVLSYWIPQETLEHLAATGKPQEPGVEEVYRANKKAI